MCILQVGKIAKEICFFCVEVIYISKEEEEKIRESFFSGINYKLNRYEF